MLAREIAHFAAGRLRLIAASAAVAVWVEMAASGGAVAGLVEGVHVDVVDW